MTEGPARRAPAPAAEASPTPDGIDIVADLARTARRILAVGAGRATRIAAEVASGGSELLAVCQPGEIADAPGVHRLDRLAQLDGHADATVDLVIVAGDPASRLEFVLATWRLLAVGGSVVLEDVRRTADVGGVLAIVFRFYREIARIDLDTAGSGLAVLQKSAFKEYVNWNRAEGREAWEVGDDDLGLTLGRLRGRASAVAEDG